MLSMNFSSLYTCISDFSQKSLNSLRAFLAKLTWHKSFKQHTHGTFSKLVSQTLYGMLWDGENSLFFNHVKKQFHEQCLHSTLRTVLLWFCFYCLYLSCYLVYGALISIILKCKFYYYQPNPLLESTVILCLICINFNFKT